MTGESGIGESEDMSETERQAVMMLREAAQIAASQIPMIKTAGDRVMVRSTLLEALLSFEHFGPLDCTFRANRERAEAEKPANVGVDIESNAGGAE